MDLTPFLPLAAAIVTGVFAVVGTLLGQTFSARVTAKTAAQRLQAEVDEKLRVERREAVVAVSRAMSKVDQAIHVSSSAGTDGWWEAARPLMQEAQLALHESVPACALALPKTAEPLGMVQLTVERWLEDAWLLHRGDRFSYAPVGGPPPDKNVIQGLAVARVKLWQALDLTPVLGNALNGGEVPGLAELEALGRGATAQQREDGR